MSKIALRLLSSGLLAEAFVVEPPPKDYVCVHAFAEDLIAQLLQVDVVEVVARAPRQVLLQPVERHAQRFTKVQAQLVEEKFVEGAPLGQRKDVFVIREDHFECFFDFYARV